MPDMTDGSKPLDPKREKFIKRLLLGDSAAEAYRNVWKNASQRTSEVEGSKLRNESEVSLRFAWLQKADEKDWRITKEKYGAWLEDILLAKPNEASDESVISATVMTKCGPFTALLDKLGAAEKLAKLRGFNEPDKVEHSGSILLVDEEIAATREKKRLARK